MDPIQGDGLTTGSFQFPNSPHMQLQIIVLRINERKPPHEI